MGHCKTDKQALRTVNCMEGRKDAKERRKTSPRLLCIPTGALGPLNGAKKESLKVKKSHMTKTVALQSSTLARKYHSLVFTFVRGGGVILKNCQRRLFQEDRVTRKNADKHLF